MSKAFRRVYFALIAMLLYIAGVQILTDRWLGDQPYLIYVASQMLHGVQLDGPLITETNPPLAVWLSVPAAWLSDVSHHSAGAIMRALIVILIAVTSTWCARIAARSRERSSLAWALLFCIASLELIVPPVFFAQREHILVILLVPWLFVCIFDEGMVYRSEKIIAGIGAALAFSLKPQQLGILALILLYRFSVARSHRVFIQADIATIFSTGTSYLLVVYTCTPYFQTIYPLLRDTYWALGPYTMTQMLMQMWPSEALLIGLVFVLLFKDAAHNRTATIFFLAALGACLAALIQHTGWLYQQIPIYFFAAMSLIAANIDLHTGRLTWGRASKLWAGLTFATLVCFSVGLMIRRVRHRFPNTHQTVDILAELPPGTAVSALSTQQTFFDIILQHRLEWTSRFGHLWMLPAILDNASQGTLYRQPIRTIDPSRAASLSVYTRSSVAEDLRLRKPYIVLVQQCGNAGGCAFLSQPTDLVEWFSKSDSFREAWRQYRLIAIDREYAAYGLTGSPMANCPGRSDQYGCPSFLHGKWKSNPKATGTE